MSSEHEERSRLVDEAIGAALGPLWGEEEGEEEEGENDAPKRDLPTI